MPLRALVALPMALIMLARPAARARDHHRPACASPLLPVAARRRLAHHLPDPCHHRHARPSSSSARSAVFEMWHGRLRGALRLPGAARAHARRGCATSPTWLPFRYMLGFPVELLIGLRARGAAALRLVATQWAWCAGVAAIAVAGVARRGPPLRGVRRADAPLPRASSAVQVRDVAGHGDAVPRRLRRRGRDVDLVAGLDPGAAARGLTATARAWPAGPFAEALVVIAWFTLLRGVLEGAINPSLLGGGRAHPHRHARLRAAQAGRRPVPGLDRALRALANDRRPRRGIGPGVLRPSVAPPTPRPHITNAIALSGEAARTSTSVALTDHFLGMSTLTLPTLLACRSACAIPVRSRTTTRAARMGGNLAVTTFPLAREFNLFMPPLSSSAGSATRAGVHDATNECRD